MKRSIRGLFAVLAAVVVLAAGFSSLYAKGPGVVVLRVKGPVSPVMFTYLDRGIRDAESGNAVAVVIQMDTPGGLDSSMRDIVQRINAARVPVVVYVSPAGARAASAGAFITMAAHVAAMAPNTAIGAAHPVGAGGEQITGTMEDKVVNDAVAYIRGIAELRGRNADWGERAVRQSVSLASDKAVGEGVADLVAPDLQTLLQQLDGRRVRLMTGETEIHTKDVPVEQVPMNFVESFLFAITDPNVAYLLLSVAMLGIFLELSNPGSILPGIVGGICLLLALFALGMLPVNIAGLLLIALGFLLFLAEVWITAHGLLSVGGILSLGLGSLILISGSVPELQVNRWLIAAVVGFFGFLVFFIVGAVIRTYRLMPATGVENLVGVQGVARTPLGPDGTVFVRGELWRARADEAPIEAGEHIRVTGIEGLELHVTRAES